MKDRLRVTNFVPKDGQRQRQDLHKVHLNRGHRAQMWRQGSTYMLHSDSEVYGIANFKWTASNSKMLDKAR